MNPAKPLILFGALAALPAAAMAQSAPVDTSKWQCKLCKFEQGASGSIEVGAGYVSDKSAKFGDYTGLNEEGGYFIGAASSRYRGADGTYWDVRASDIGLDSRSASIEGGRQGSYRLFLNSDVIPRYYSDTAQTPFRGSGSTLLTLPAGFPAGTTALMPLATTLQRAELENKRSKLGLGGSWSGLDQWQFDLSYRRENRFGSKRTSGALFVNAAQLVEPLDMTTDQLDASAAYTGEKLQVKFAYYGSRFANGNESLTWANPFTPILGGAAGQLALAPDNQFHQFSGSIAYQFTERTRASADIAWGRMTQNESFLAPTLNAGLPAPVLPGSSLNGRANTLNANVRISSRVTDEVRLFGAYLHDERDNQTAQSVYPWVTTDMFVATPRTNLPYSFTQDRVKLGGDYRISPQAKLAAGLDYDARERTFQSAEKTDETSGWAKGHWKALENLDLSLKLETGERRNSGYQAVPGIIPPDNPLMRKYNLANRSREKVGVRADFSANEAIQIGFGFDTANDRYKDSSIGLTSAKDYNLYGDVSALLTAQTSLNAFANHQRIKSQQSGSQVFANPDWNAENRDTVDVLGFGVKHAAIKDRLDLGADYVYTRTRAAIQVEAGAPSPAFPDLATTMHSFKLYANYKVDAQLSVHGGYWYERYTSDNWMLDGVSAATIPNVLTFGEASPQYKVHVLRASMRYQF